MSEDFLGILSRKMEEDERKKADVVRRKAQKDNRLKTKLDKFFYYMYELLLRIATWNQKNIQKLVNHRNKYSETYLVHDSQRVFAELLQGDQLGVLQELNLIGARKLGDSRLLLTFATLRESITPNGIAKVPDQEGMLVVIDSILDHDVPFLKVGMDTWSNEDKLTKDDEVPSEQYPRG